MLTRRQPLLRKSPLQRGPLRRVSEKRAAELREYIKRKKAFMAKEENQFCPVAEAGLIQIDIGGGWVGTPILHRTTDVHHKDGREHSKLNDESQWLAVSREGHAWIHAHPGQARKRGWLK